MNSTYILIGLLASASYLIGFKAIFRGGYRPNLFTRTVFLCLAVNNLASVLKLGNQVSTTVLAWVTLLGSLLVFVGAIFRRAENLWGKTETISTILLIISFILWVFTDIPVLNLFIGLIAHSIGSLPTVVRAIKKPESENIPFWGLFALASIVALLSTTGHNFKDYLFVTYFCIFDSGMTILALRKYFKKKAK